MDVGHKFRQFPLEVAPVLTQDQERPACRNLSPCGSCDLTIDMLTSVVQVGSLKTQDASIPGASSIG